MRFVLYMMPALLIAADPPSSNTLEAQKLWAKYFATDAVVSKEKETADKITADIAKRTAAAKALEDYCGKDFQPYIDPATQEGSCVIKPPAPAAQPVPAGALPNPSNQSKEEKK